ncbi:hypothetical protein D3C85_603240 [compost metagenome]
MCREVLLFPLHPQALPNDFPIAPEPQQTPTGPRPHECAEPGHRLVRHGPRAQRLGRRPDPKHCFAHLRHRRRFAVQCAGAVRGAVRGVVVFRCRLAEGSEQPGLARQLHRAVRFRHVAARQRLFADRHRRRQLHRGTAGQQRRGAGAGRHHGQWHRHRSRYLCRRSGGPFGAPGRAGQSRYQRRAVQRGQLHRQDHRGSAGANRRRCAAQRRVSAPVRGLRQLLTGVHHPRSAVDHRRHFVQWPVRRAATADHHHRSVGAGRAVQGPERVHQRCRAGRQRHRRQRQPGAQARAGHPDPQRDPRLRQ